MMKPIELAERQPDVPPKLSRADKRGGPARKPAPLGHLYCTLGEHTAPISEFPTAKQKYTSGTSRVRYCSWCRTCKREYDRESQQKSRKRKREKAGQS